MKEIDHTYRKTAIARRLMNPEERGESNSEIQAALRKITMKKRAGQHRLSASEIAREIEA